MSTQEPRSVSPSPPQFGDSRPTAHVTNHATIGRTSQRVLILQKSSEEKTARDLLRNVQEDDEMDSGRRRSGGMRVFGRRSPSLQEPPQGDDPVNKHYIKMGILISEESRSKVTQSLASESRLSTGSALKRTHTLPSSSPQARRLFTIRGDREGDESLPEVSRPLSRPRTNSSGFELIDLVSDEEEHDVVTQPSPPISVKSGSSNNTVHGEDELLASSPDSGYGNTPEYLNATRSSDPESKGRQQPSGATNDSIPDERVRSEADICAFSMDSVGDSQHHGRPAERPPLKHTSSVPGNLAALNRPPLSLPETVPEGGVPFPFQMSLAPGRPSLNGIETGSAVNLAEMERQLEQRAHHHVNPSQLSPHPNVRGQINSSQSLVMDPRKRKTRGSSQSFSTVTEIQSMSPMKSSTLPAPPPESKDYFQLTDELSKENSHFSLSEALLGVIEQYKANCIEQQQQDESSPPSTPPAHSWKDSPSGLTPIGGWHYLKSPGRDSLEGSPVGSYSSMSSVFERSHSEVELSQSARRPSQLSLLELMQSPSWDNSAESTAQKLLRHMTGHMTRTNSDNSQVVVQVPTEFLASLQRDEDLQKSVTTSSAHMRGNREWAPPRKQIIYSSKQPSRNLQKDLAAQGFRCTGCGMKVNPSYIKYFRFCNYTGKYFCQNCHMNATSLIPAYILERWSFKRFYVSNFARDLLAKIYSDPVFTISSSNASIYGKVPPMAQARDLRSQLISVKQYLATCRSDYAQQLNLSFQGYAPWTVDLHTYSIEDFVEIKSGVKMKYLRAMLADGVAHIKGCPLCMGKGFVCELCADQNIIFPFENSKVSTCRDCQCCFHKTCFSPTSECPRCQRMHLRLKQRAKAAESNKPPVRDYSVRPS